MALITEHLQRVGLIEASWVRANAASFPRHTHDEYVLSANLQGHEQIWLDGHYHDVPPGAVTLYNPLAVQGSAFGPQGVEYISLHLSPDALREVVAEQNLDNSSGHPVFTQGVLHSPALLKAIVEFATCDAPQEQEETWLTLLCQLLEQDTAHRDEHNTGVRHSIAFMREHLYRRIELEELAAISRLSKFHFVRCFKKATGLAPLQYHMQLRLIEARQQLRAGLHPLEVAQRLNFYDQSHFINAFRRVMGVTPNSYWSRLHQPA